MTALPYMQVQSGNPAQSLFARQRMLTTWGLAWLLLAPIPLLLAEIDPRLLPSGISPWVKPAKFLISTGLFAVTAAFFYGYVAPQMRDGRLLRRAAFALVGATMFELVWIGWQAAMGTESHFNNSSVLNAIMFALMGVFALILTATTLPLAWAIARHPREGLDPVQRDAAAAGLVLTWLLGTASGIVMSVNGAHAVGAEASRVPLFHWNQIGGDLRVAHFLGIHAEQILPLGILMLVLLGVGREMQRRALWAGAALLVTLFAAIQWQALAGLPLIRA